MLAPDGFQRALNAFDPLLRVRRGNVVGKWVIERKAFIPEMELMYLRKRTDRTFRIARGKQDVKERTRLLALASQIAEETESASRGYRVIIFVDDLDRRVFDMLALSDTKRYGGFSRYIEELEANEQRRAKDEARQDANEREAVHKETFDKLNFVWNHRETQLLDGKRKMSELLR